MASRFVVGNNTSGFPIMEQVLTRLGFEVINIGKLRKDCVSAYDVDDEGQIVVLQRDQSAEDAAESLGIKLEEHVVFHQYSEHASPSSVLQQLDNKLHRQLTRCQGLLPESAAYAIVADTILENQLGPHCRMNVYLRMFYCFMDTMPDLNNKSAGKVVV